MKIKNKLYYLTLSIAIISCGKDKPIVTPEVKPITITEFYPEKMITGRELTIIGTNFDPIPANNVVKINGELATVNSGTTTSLIITIPKAATSGKITINKGTLVTSSTDFTVINNPYQNVRLKQIYNETTKKRRLFFYDSGNRLITQKIYTTSDLGIESLENTTTYSYTESGKLDKDVFEFSSTPKIAYVSQYAYVNGLLSAYTSSTLDATKTPTLTTITNSAKYDYLKGMINTVTYFNPGTTIVNQVTKYNYSILDGNPKMVSNQTADASPQSPILSANTTVSYADILSPLSLVMPPALQGSLLLTKSLLFSNVTGTFSYTYSLDSRGKIISITSTHPINGSFTESYTYENKN